MSNQVYSSKSLLDAIGSEARKSADRKASEPTEEIENDGGSFLLANTFAHVPKPEQEGNNSNEVSKEPLKDNETKGKDIGKEDIVGKGKLTGSDVESVTSGIVMNTSEEKDRTKESKTIQLLPLLNPSNLLSSHDLLLSAFYEEHKYELVEQRKLTMRVITWNLNQMKPPSLSSLAGKSGREWAAFFYAGDATVNEYNKEGLADIYAINFQETISLKSFTKSNGVIDEWVTFLLAVLNAISSDSYSLVHKTGLLGLTSILIAKSNLTADNSDDTDGHIHDIRENTLGLGYLRWANKGCISLRFRVGGLSLGVGEYKSRFIAATDDASYTYKFSELDETAGKIPGLEIQVLNVHLVHGEDSSQIQQRWDSWAKIESKIGLDDRTVKLALDSSKMEVKDAAQKRVEMKLQQKLHKESNLDADNYEHRMDKEMKALNLNNDAIRTSSVPITFSATELKKFDGIFSSVDIKNLKYVTEAQKALVVCGDTNYRLSLPTEATSNLQKVIHELIKNGRWNDLIQHDQLSREISLKKIFVGFKEPEIHFAPTFKVKNDCIGNWIITPPSSSSSSSPELVVKPNTSTSKLKRRPVPVPASPSGDSAPSVEPIPFYVPLYDTKRLPAYTDRILYVPRPYFNVIEGTYTSTGNSGSDHLPVASTYEFEAPLIDYNKLHVLRGKFTEAWDAVINQMKFIEVNNKVTINHSMESMKAQYNWQTLAPCISETVSTDGGNVAFSAIVGETIYITINIENVVDESFNIYVKEQTSGGWFGTKIGVNCQQVQSYNKTEFPLRNFSPSCNIESHSKGEIIFSLVPTNSGLLERMFVTEIPEYSLCPAYRKFIALTINVEDIFGISFENITPQQFENLTRCFDFVCSEPIKGLLERMEDLGSSGDLNSADWELVREISLWKFSPEKYKQQNIDGVEAVKRREPEKFNLGSKTVMSVIYIWLKSQSSSFNTDSPRGKVIFGKVIKLVKHLKLDAEDGYSWFGWLFGNEYELGDYLERDFDVKVQL